MNRRVKTFVCILLLPLFFAVAGENVRIGYRKVAAELPEGWIAQSLCDSSMIFIFYSPEELNDTFRERITVSCGARPDDMSNSEVVDELKQNFMTFYDSYQIVDDGWTHIVLDGVLTGTHIRQYIKFIVKKNMTYCVTATALPETYDSWEPVFKKIIGSIKIKN